MQLVASIRNILCSGTFVKARTTMLILGIETSCDETAASIVEDGVYVLSNVIATSKSSFKKLAGVIPEEAARRQVECIIPVIEQALQEADLPVAGGQWPIDCIAVTKGPGLLGSLLVGTATARILASLWKKPLIGVHHTLGHLSSTWLKPCNQTPETSKPTNQSLTTPRFPMLTLSASGGHTDLWYRSSHTAGKLLGRTRDDAAGEAFDKGASLLGLPYPGGPEISKASEGGNSNAFNFPLPLKDENTLDFSFSGLKTSLKYLLRDLKFEIRNVKSETNQKHEDQNVSDFAASYQHAICAHLLHRIEKARKDYPDIKEMHLVGGVSANSYLRSLLQKQLHQCSVCFPQTLAYCTDNAAMIAAAGYFMLQECGEQAVEPFETLASLALQETMIRTE